MGSKRVSVWVAPADAPVTGSEPVVDPNAYRAPFGHLHVERVAAQDKTGDPPTRCIGDPPTRCIGEHVAKHSLPRVGEHVAASHRRGVSDIAFFARLVALEALLHFYHVPFLVENHVVLVYGRIARQCA